MINPADPTKITPPEGSPNKGSSSRFILSLQCGMVMFACAAGYGGYITWETHSLPNFPFAILYGIPAVATIFFIVAGELIPGLFAPKRLAFPLTLTLPMVFNAFILLAATLITSTGNSLIAPFEQLKVARLWQSPAVLCLVGICQILCLSALASLKSGSVE